MLKKKLNETTGIKILYFATLIYKCICILASVLVYWLIVCGGILFEISIYIVPFS